MKQLINSFKNDIAEIKLDGKQVKDDIHAIRLTLVGNYATREEVKEMMATVKQDFLSVIVATQGPQGEAHQPGT